MFLLKLYLFSYKRLRVCASSPVSKMSTTYLAFLATYHIHAGYRANIDHLHAHLYRLNNKANKQKIVYRYLVYPYRKIKITILYFNYTIKIEY